MAAAALMGHTEVVEALLRLGCDPNAPGPTGATALMLAAWQGHADAVAALLQRGAAVDAADADGGSASGAGTPSLPSSWSHQSGIPSPS